MSHFSAFELFKFKKFINVAQRNIMLFVGLAMSHNQPLVVMDMCLLVFIQKSWKLAG